MAEDEGQPQRGDSHRERTANVREGTVVTAIYLSLPFHLYLGLSTTFNSIQYNLLDHGLLHMIANVKG